MGVLLAIPLVLAADPFVVLDNDHTVAYACTPDAAVQITGNQNRVTLTGQCATVDVLGNQNTVRVEASRAITVTGNQNAVTWERGAGKDAPKVSNVGNGNRVSRKQ